MYIRGSESSRSKLHKPTHRFGLLRDVENPTDHQALGTIDIRLARVEEIQNAGGRIDEQGRAVHLDRFDTLGEFLNSESGRERFVALVEVYFGCAITGGIHDDSFVID